LCVSGSDESGEDNKKPIKSGKGLLHKGGKSKSNKSVSLVVPSNSAHQDLKSMQPKLPVLQQTEDNHQRQHHSSVGAETTTTQHAHSAGNALLKKLTHLEREINKDRHEQDSVFQHVYPDLHSLTSNSLARSADTSQDDTNNASASMDAKDTEKEIEIENSSSKKTIDTNDVVLHAKRRSTRRPAVFLSDQQKNKNDRSNSRRNSPAKPTAGMPMAVPTKPAMPKPSASNNNARSNAVGTNCASIAGRMRNHQLQQQQNIADASSHDDVNKVDDEEIDEQHNGHDHINDEKKVDEDDNIQNDVADKVGELPSFVSITSSSATDVATPHNRKRRTVILSASAPTTRAHIDEHTGVQTGAHARAATAQAADGDDDGGSLMSPAAREYKDSTPGPTTIYFNSILRAPNKVHSYGAISHVPPHHPFSDHEMTTAAKKVIRRKTLGHHYIPPSGEVIKSLANPLLMGLTQDDIDNEYDNLKYATIATKFRKQLEQNNEEMRKRSHQVPVLQLCLL
jgi:hypothetical protein